MMSVPMATCTVTGTFAAYASERTLLARCSNWMPAVAPSRMNRPSPSPNPIRSCAAEFIAAGAYALGVGADLLDAAALREGNLEKITSAARVLVQTVAAARPAKSDKKTNQSQN